MHAKIVLIVAVFVLGGLVKGVTGMGLPTVAMGLLGALLPPAAAASLLVVPSFVTNVWQLVAGPALGALALRLATMMLGVVVGTFAGASVLTGDSTTWAVLGLGAALVASSAYSLLARPGRVPARAEPWLSPLVGLATGLVTGATGVFVLPAVPYIQALGLERDDLVQALGLSFTLSTIALALALVWHGALHAGDLMHSTLAVVPALIGMQLGQSVRQRLSQAAFRRWFLIGLIALGADLMLRPLL